MATNTPPKNVNGTISDIVRSFDKDINRYRIDIGKSQTAYLLDDIRNTALNNIDGIVASIGGDSTALGKEFRSKWTDTINAAYQVRKTQIEKKFKSDQDFLKSRLEEKKNLEAQLVKLREISKNKEQKISAEQKKNIQKLITFQKEKIKKIETLQNNVVKKSISIEDAKKEYSDLIEKNKEIDKTIEEYTGVESFKESTNDLERIIEDFLKDQRKSKSVKTFGQTMASHGGVLGVRKAAHAYGLQQGERLRKKISKMFGIGELENHHERWLEKQLDIYQDELKESGTPEEQAIKQVNDYERNLRSNLSRGVKEKDVLGEKDLSTIAEQSKKTSKYTTKEAKPTAAFINNMAEVHATGGKLSGNLDIVGERGLEIVKGNEVLSPEGNTRNMSKWFTAFKEIAGVKNPKKHPLEVHIIKIKNDVNSIKEFLIKQFDYIQEKDEDEWWIREKLDKEPKEIKTNIPVASDQPANKQKENNSLIDDILISKLIEKILTKLLPSGIPPVPTPKSLAPAVATAGTIATAVAVIGGTVWAAYDTVSDAVYFAKDKEAVDYSTFDEQRLYIADQAKKEFDRLAEETYKLASDPWNYGAEGSSAYALSQMKNLDEVVRSGIDIDGIVPLTETIDQWRQNKNNSVKEDQPVKDAIIQDRKITRFDKDDVVAIGTDLNQSKKGGLSQTLKEAMKDVSTDIINAFNPREMKQITLDMYEKTIAVWQQSEANKKKEASNTIISNTNNNILGGGSSAVREKYIPVELDFVRY